MIDAVFALVLILSVVFGAKRGLFRSFMALAAIVLALIGASLLTDALTEPVTDMLMPRLEKSVEEWFDTESQTPQGDVPQIEGRPRRRATPRVKRQTATPRRTRKTFGRTIRRSR